MSVTVSLITRLGTGKGEGRPSCTRQVLASTRRGERHTTLDQELVVPWHQPPMAISFNHDFKDECDSATCLMELFLKSQRQVFTEVLFLPAESLTTIKKWGAIDSTGQHAGTKSGGCEDWAMTWRTGPPAALTWRGGGRTYTWPSPLHKCALVNTDLKAPEK